MIRSSSVSGVGRRGVGVGYVDYGYMFTSTFIIMNVGYKDVDKGAETISGSTEAVRVKSMGVVIILT